jgi:hypothetical protein
MRSYSNPTCLTLICYDWADPVHVVLVAAWLRFQSGADPTAMDTFFIAYLFSLSIHVSLSMLYQSQRRYLSTWRMVVQLGNSMGDRLWFAREMVRSIRLKSSSDDLCPSPRNSTNILSPQYTSSYLVPPTTLHNQPRRLRHQRYITAPPPN